MSVQGAIGKVGLFRKVMSGALLITGTSVGAGMLGIPLVTAAAGFFPAMIVTVVVWIFMMLTGLLLLEVGLSMPKKANFLTLSEKFCGQGGKIATGGLFIFLYYFLMIAYFAVGGPLMGKIAGSLLFGAQIPHSLGVVLFGVVFGWIVAKGPKSIDKVNLILTVCMFASLALLIAIGSEDVRAENLMSRSFPAMIFAMPVLFSAFGYHNMIPSLVTYLDKDRKALTLSIILGTTLPLGIYLIWQWLVIGSVGMNEIALQKQVGFSALGIIGQCFAFFAITTSTLGVGFSLVDFLGDGMKIDATGKYRVLLVVFTFLPPMVMTLIDPDIFDKALGVAGGIGESLLNGLLPVIMAFVARYVQKSRIKPLVGGAKPLLYLLMAASIFVLGIEIYLLDLL